MATNLEAATAFIAHLRSQDRLSAVDEARASGFLAMAAELDADPGNASLWKAYWQVEDLLRGDVDSETDRQRHLLDRIAGAAEVGDPAD